MADLFRKQKSGKQSAENSEGITVAIIGSSGCGKSTMLRRIFLDDIYRPDDNPEKDYIVTIYTESARSEAFRNMSRKINIDRYGIDDNQLNNMKRQNDEMDKEYNFVVVLDDCIHVRYQSVIEKMFLTWRNTNITSIISLQYPNLIPKAIRCSVYFTFLFCLNTEEGILIAVEGWLSAYLEGRNMREKMDTYRRWTHGGDGHRFFMYDSNNNTCFRVDENYYCEEMKLVSFASGGVDGGGGGGGGGGGSSSSSSSNSRGEIAEEQRKIPEWLHDLY